MLSSALKRRPIARALLASGAIVAMLALGGCNMDGPAPNGRALAPLSDKMLADIEQKMMSKEAPILVRIFKEESELEVWKEDKSGSYALLKTYPICRWSGELGPKIKEGDRQAPEGFYAITPGQMNPNSQYYLAFNLGFPNSFDKAHGRTGMHLMVHGDCSSRGCYSMTDEQIAELYALAREAFFGGQKSFQVQAYPFRMTGANMAKHRNNPHLAFWKMLKQGNDHFEVTRHEPKVDVCERKYVFDAQPANASPLKFKPTEVCPVYQTPDDIVALVGEKQQKDDVEFTRLAMANVPTAPIRTGRDGGMNPVFVAAISQPEMTNDGMVRSLAPSRAPGTVPPHAVIPGAGMNASPTLVAETPVETKVAVAEPAKTVNTGTGLFGGLFSSAPASKAPPAKDAAPKASPVIQQAKAPQIAPPKEEPKKPAAPSMIERATRFVGLRGSDTATPAPAPASPPPAPRYQTASAPADAPRPPGAIQASAAPRPQQNAGAIARPQPLDEPEKKPAGATATIAGAQPVVPSNNFGDRWGGLR